MNFVSLVFGSGARAKRAYRGCERDWNKYGEYARKFMQHGRHMKKSASWVAWKRRHMKDLDWKRELQ